MHCSHKAHLVHLSGSVNLKSENNCDGNEEPTDSGRDSSKTPQRHSSSAAESQQAQAIETDKDGAAFVADDAERQGEMEPERADDKPVSYTHLDVYKRQPTPFISDTA